MAGLQTSVGAAQRPVSEVYAAFESTIGPAGVREVRMFVDGTDVTTAASISAGRVSYIPSEPLSAGPHQAQVVVVDTLGRRHEKSWTFSEATGTLGRITFDALPRQVTRAALVVAGDAPPDTEVDLHVNGVSATRTTASSSGRFTARVDLDRGLNEISARAEQPGAAEFGPEASVRVELVELVDPAPPNGGSAAPVPVRRGDDLARGLPGRGVPPIDVVVRDPTPPRQSAPPPERPPDVRTPGRTGGIGRGEPVDPFETAPPRPDAPARFDAPPRAGGPPSPGTQRPVEPALPPLEVEDPEGPAPLPGELVITKPTDGDEIRAAHVTVLGRAPARWRVVVLVNGRSRGNDQANPAGHFTVPKVALEAGDNELVAEATSPDGTQSLTSDAVRIVRGEDVFAATDLALTSPSRPTSVSRTGSVAVEGTAWDGAEIEVEVNGRIAATGIAGASGRFSVTTPLEAGSNHVLVEALDSRTGRSSRSRLMSVTSTTLARREFEGPIRVQPPPKGGGGIGDRKPVPMGTGPR